MKVAVVVRPDFQVKPGGDLVQARAYADWLRRGGHDAAVVSVGDGLPGADLAFLFNMDLLSEWTRAGRALLRAGLPYLAVPIHHPWTWLGAFERHGRSGLLAASNVLLRTPGARDRSRDVVRARSLGALAWHVGHPRSLAVQATEVLEGATSVVYLAEGEREHVRRDFGRAPEGVVAHNGVAMPSTPDPGPDRDVDVVVMGRIERRKNQVRLATALAGSGLRVVFAGHASSANRRYLDELQAVIARDPRMAYVGQLDREGAADLLSRARVSASASWVEVASLVDIEAHVAGCGVVGSTRGFSAEYELGAMAQVDPDAPLGVLRATCLEAVGGWSPPAPEELERRRRRHHWDHTLRPLADLLTGTSA